MTDTLQFRDALHEWAREFVPAYSDVESVRIDLIAEELPEFRVVILFEDLYGDTGEREVFDDLTDPENLFALLSDDTDDD